MNDTNAFIAKCILLTDVSRFRCTANIQNAYTMFVVSKKRTIVDIKLKLSYSVFKKLRSLSTYTSNVQCALWAWQICTPNRKQKSAWNTQKLDTIEKFDAKHQRVQKAICIIPAKSPVPDQVDVTLASISRW